MLQTPYDVAQLKVRANEPPNVAKYAWKLYISTAEMSSQS